MNNEGADQTVRFLPLSESLGHIIWYPVEGSRWQVCRLKNRISLIIRAVWSLIRGVDGCFMCSQESNVSSGGTCADPESFVRGSPTLTTVFYNEMEDPSTTISGPPSARQQNAIKWRFAGVPMMA